ncbi:hypothetical protein T440DRAFT_394520 [Plenodomus tracheiphilus IPT5]|uniref:Uncharacterized protein n=1 Tax=Plenodomus tracheiphilus IPT5 TaxID=1408161 RepID=A0A6A7B8A1_9PLEO|nr:hypothetical protein T440DRAFT_394520 [Plenodomus tracheiphilus IPT5]
MTPPHNPSLLTHPWDVARPALVVGAVSAVPGLTIGALYGTLRTKTPVLFSLVSGAQWSIIGTTFWGARTSILNSTGLSNWWKSTRAVPSQLSDDYTHTQDDKIRASAIAGAFTGSSLGLLFRGPRNVIPGTIMFTLFGWAGQHGYNYLDARNSTEIKQNAELKAKGEDRPKESLMHRFAKSKWSPMTVLSDEEYERLMQEKMLYFEAQIAVIDDRIAEFRKQAADATRQEARTASQTPTTDEK